jgi:hypothetical protein
MTQDFLLDLPLGAGFRVVRLPLFFYWSHIGSAITFVPLPLALLAGMGFVSRFSELLIRLSLAQSWNELFGIESGLLSDLPVYIIWHQGQ